ncbi:MAG: hypothetical protein ABL895_15750 [Cyclobacteriaceae bacterium]
MKRVILIFPVIMLFSIAAWAQEITPKVNERQVNQRSRIHEGRMDGDLTRNETTLLNKEQKHIRRSEYRAKADGDVNVKERRRLDRKQDRANRHIRKAKNNDATKAN